MPIWAAWQCFEYYTEGVEVSSCFQSALITLQTPALFSWCQTGNTIKCSEEAATHSRGPGWRRGLIRHRSSYSPLISICWQSNKNERLMRVCEAAPHPECIYTRVRLWFSFSNTSRVATKKNTANHMRTHIHTQTPTASIGSPTHHSIQMLSVCFPPSAPVNLRWLFGF